MQKKKTRGTIYSFKRSSTAVYKHVQSTSQQTTAFPPHTNDDAIKTFNKLFLAHSPINAFRIVLISTKPLSCKTNCPLLTTIVTMIEIFNLFRYSYASRPVFHRCYAPPLNICEIRWLLRLSAGEKCVGLSFFFLIPERDGYWG